MRKEIIPFIPLFILCACSKELRVEKSRYLWKNFSDSAHQSIDLSTYHSPNTRPDQNKDRLVILSATGGGSRAAAFTIGVLLELEKFLLAHQLEKDSNQNILSEVDYYSTVSGGGWGISSYIAYLHQKNKYGQSFPFKTYNSYETLLANYMDRAYARYQLWYALRGIFTRQSNYISNAIIMDRLNSGYMGWVNMKNFEEALWKQNGNGEFSPDSVQHILLSDVFKLKTSPGSPVLPMFIANATNLSNYMVVPFSPDRLKWWGVKQYTFTTSKGPQLHPIPIAGALSLQQLLQIPLVAGVKASSSVPGFIGSSVFASNKNGLDYILRLEDGGITDNFGLHTVKSILEQEKDISDKTKRIVIVVDASASGVRSANEDAKKISRLNSVGKFLSAAPDAQYPLTRERIIALEREYNCTVIYLGAEVLLDNSLGEGGPIPSNLTISRDEAERKFYNTYFEVLKNPIYYNGVSMNERSLLYEYIRTNVSTWFSAKRTNNKGRYLEKLVEVRGTARIMTLAGRAVVQLKRKELLGKFENF